MRVITTVVFAVVAMMTPVGGQDSTAFAKWLDIGENEAALAVFWDWAAVPPEYAVFDGSHTELDKVEWSGDLPLLRQYRLQPGSYDIFVNGAGYEGVSLEPGTVTYVYFSGSSDKWTIAHGADAFAKAMVGDLVAALNADGEPTQPVELAPAGNTIIFNTEPPWDIPKPRPGGGPKPNE